MTSGAVMPIVRVADPRGQQVDGDGPAHRLPLREILPAVQRLVVPAAQNGDDGDSGTGDVAPFGQHALVDGPL